MLPIKPQERNGSTILNIPVRKASEFEKESLTQASGTEGSLGSSSFATSSHNIGDTEPVKVRSYVMWKKRYLALSQQACRFELPMDMRRLETMTPLEYIQEFTVISSRRRMLYQRVWTLNKKNDIIPYKDLEKAVKEVLVNTMTSDHFDEVREILQFDSSLVVDQRMFFNICAICERLTFPKIKIYGPYDMTDFVKEDLEAADFSALKWRLEGVNCNEHTLTLLKLLAVPGATQREE